MSERMDRMSKLLMREISVIFQDKIDDPRIKHIMLTRVEITKDMHLAKVFYEFLGTENEKKELARGLESVSRFVRASLAESMSLKFTPEISFREDVQEEKNKHIDDIFKTIETERMQCGQDGHSEDTGSVQGE